MEKLFPAKLLPIYMICIVLQIVVGVSHYDTNNNGRLKVLNHSNTVDGRKGMFAEGPRYSSNSVYSYEGPQPFTSRSFKPVAVKSGRIKVKRMESNPSPIMNFDKSHEHLTGEENKSRYNEPLMMTYGLEPEYRNLQHFYHSQREQQQVPQMAYYMMQMMEELEAKEAALKGFGIGLAIGLGTLGAVLGLLFLKFLLIPLLAIATLLPSLLPMAPIVPAPGKIIVGLVPNSPRISEVANKETKLQEAIEDIVKKLPTIIKTQYQKKERTKNEQN